MQSGKRESQPVRRLALTSAVAGAALLGCATPAVADQGAADLNPKQSEGTSSTENPKLAAARHRLNKAEAALTKAHQDLDTAQEEKAKADSNKDRSTRIHGEKRTAYNQARNTPALTQAQHRVETATTEHDQAKAAFDRAQQEVTRLEHLESGSGATITELTEARDQAKAALDHAELTTASRRAAAAEADQLRPQGTAGYFKHKGATGAYNILTDSGYSDKTHGSIQLGQSGDATSIDQMLETLQWLDEANRIRAAEGKRELQVSDTLMAMAQADADWSRDNNNDHARVFPIGENLIWTSPTSGYNPFDYWYTEEKGNKVKGEGETGHYENVINDNYAFTGIAISNASNGMITMAQTFQFTAPSVTRSLDPNLYWAGNHNSSTADYFQDINDYLNFLDNAQAELTSAQAAETAARADLDARQRALDAAQSVPSPSTGLIAARNTRDLARTNLDAADSNLTNAQATLTAAQAAVDSDPDVVAALQALNEANDNLSKANHAIALADSNLATARRNLADALAERAAAYQELTAALVSGGLGVDNRPVDGVVTGKPAKPSDQRIVPQAPAGGPGRLALTGSDSLIAATAAASLCATAMGAFAIRRKALF